MKKFDVIIIGSGLGGLLCGYILSKEGFSVCILEKESKPGGNLQTFTRHGHRFETGVHYIGGLIPDQPLYRYWKYFGLTDALPLKPLDPNGFDRIGFGDHEFPLAQGFENFREQLLPFFPVEEQTLSRYTAALNEIASAFPLYNLELPGNHNETIFRTKSACGFYKSFSSGFRNPASCINGSSPGWEKPEPGAISLSSVLSGNNFLYAGTPSTPLHMAALINHSFISGACRISGGSDQITQILVKGILAQGGVVLTAYKVIKIGKTGSDFSVETSRNETISSARLISAIHPRITLSMLPEQMVRPAYKARIDGLPDTISSFTLYLILKPGSFPYLNYNYYHHETIDVWNETGDTGTSWPAMYMLSTACHAPDQQYAETVTILSFMDREEVKKWENTISGNRGKEYQEFKEEKAARLMVLVEKKFPGLKSAVIWMEASTPLTWRDYTGTPGGAMYGIRRDCQDILHTTVLPKTKIPGLYFTGQNINLHGMLGVTIGSVMTCGEIIGLDYLIKKIKDG
ncbi:MAG: NAD(P)-binding protein [Bacteroidota bacterium]